MIVRCTFPIPPMITQIQIHSHTNRNTHNYMNTQTIHTYKEPCVVVAIVGCIFPISPVTPTPVVTTHSMTYSEHLYQIIGIVADMKCYDDEHDNDVMMMKI